jgi:hypothetical protein
VEHLPQGSSVGQSETNARRNEREQSAEHPTWCKRSLR